MLANPRCLNCTCYCTAEVWGHRCRSWWFLSLRRPPFTYIWLILKWFSLYSYVAPKLKNIHLNGTQASHTCQFFLKNRFIRVYFIIQTLHKGYILINQALHFPGPKFQSAKNTPFRSVKNGKWLPAPKIRGMPLESICFLQRWKGEGGGGGGGCVTIAGTLDAVTCCTFGWTYKILLLKSVWKKMHPDAQFRQHNCRASHLFLWDGITDEIKHNRINQSRTVRPHDVNTDPNSNCGHWRTQKRKPICHRVAKSSPRTGTKIFIMKRSTRVHFLKTCLIWVIASISNNYTYGAFVSVYVREY